MRVTGEKTDKCDVENNVGNEGEGEEEEKKRKKKKETEMERRRREERIMRMVMRWN